MPSAQEIYEEKVLGKYFETSQKWRSDSSPEALERTGQEYEAQFGHYLPPDPDAPILEIGCGRGAFLSLCADRGFRKVTGVDVAKDQIEFCRSRGLENAICSDGLTYLRDSEGSFATIVLLDVLEHMPKRRGFAMVACAQERLRENGRLIVRAPNMSNPLNLQARYGDFQHEIGFSKESMTQLFRAAGLSVERIYSPNPDLNNPIAHLIFDIIAWKAFAAIYRRTFRLTREVIRGKNLIGVARRRGENG
jgi:2-polyprenyl-3-methyl-5-hydroxy-6-metoxy-1,4-benzoquinol methylase